MLVAREAVDLLSEHPILLGQALALEAVALAGLGQVADAWRPALAALKITDDLGGQLSNALMPAAFVAELHARGGDRRSARDVAIRGLARAEWYASRYTAEDEELRLALLARPEVVTLREHAALRDA